ncbi:MAG TPA: hypothetical protein VJZ01_01050 [Lachnospiraceae bacterium]|jgi:flagellar biosynthesis/type III secretory pathway M-ring protein FliF/YscJ|nr:hypothetical protein [Lachnospiraceae bacterium]
MNTKKIPAAIMLLAGAVTCIVTFINGYTTKDMLVALFWVLVLFLIIGIVVKKILDSFQLPDENAVGDEGEVIEKEPADGETAGEENQEKSEDSKEETKAES